MRSSNEWSSSSRVNSENPPFDISNMESKLFDHIIGLKIRKVQYLTTLIRVRDHRNRMERYLARLIEQKKDNEDIKRVDSSMEIMGQNIGAEKVTLRIMEQKKEKEQRQGQQKQMNQSESRIRRRVEPNPVKGKILASQDLDDFEDNAESKQWLIEQILSYQQLNRHIQIQLGVFIKGQQNQNKMERIKQKIQEISKILKKQQQQEIINEEQRAQKEAFLQQEQKGEEQIQIEEAVRTWQVKEYIKCQEKEKELLFNELQVLISQMQMMKLQNEELKKQENEKLCF